MASITCSRCKQEKEGLSQTPLPGALGDRVAAQTCTDCWKEWLGAQVILINENSLSPAKPADYTRLTQEMSTFLALDAPAEG